MIKITHLFLGTLFFTGVLCPKSIAATHDDTYDHLSSDDQVVRVSYEFKTSNLRDDIKIDVMNDGGARGHLLTIPHTLDIELDKVYRVKGYLRESAKKYLEFSSTIDGNISPVYLYDKETQEPDFSTTARVRMVLKGQPLEPVAKPLESFRFIIGKVYPDLTDSPLYVSVVCKHGAKGESKKTVSSPTIVRRKISMVNSNSNA